MRQGAAEAAVHCDVLAGKRKVEVEVEVVPGRRDRAWHNGQRVPGTRGLLEVLRTTLFTPDDLALVKGSPSGRRDFVDDVLAKSYPRLGADRSGLDRVLRHRNALLRQLGGRLDSEAATTLDIWDDRLAQIGERLAHSRAEMVEALSPYAAEAFSILAAQAGGFSMRYVRSWDGTLGEALAAARREDLQAGDDDRRPAARRRRDRGRWSRRAHQAFARATTLHRPFAASFESSPNDDDHGGNTSASLG